MNVTPRCHGVHQALTPYLCHCTKAHASCGRPVGPVAPGGRGGSGGQPNPGDSGRQDWAGAMPPGPGAHAIVLPNSTLLYKSRIHRQNNEEIQDSLSRALNPHARPFCATALAAHHETVLPCTQIHEGHDIDLISCPTSSLPWCHENRPVLALARNGVGAAG